jgi:DNA polymerase
MPDIYDELLNATIAHLEGLKARGAQFVNVSPEALAGLKKKPVSSVEGRGPIRTPPPVSLPSDARGKATPSPVPGKASPPNPVETKPLTEQAFTFVAPPERAMAPAPFLSAEAKAAAFADLRERAMACVKCPHLAASRRNVVFGVGNTDSELMFVGEAPGEDEDVQGEPFVGRAGQLLTKIIQTMGLGRGDVYIANILKCRPDTPGQSSGNRKPTPEEMQTCIPYLHEQIDLIRPKVLVALGGTAVEGLLGKTIGIMKLRGQWQTYRGIPLMPTYHPAYLLRNQAMTEKRRVWEDMLKVMERLGMQISEKQRRFFVK